MVKTVWNAPYAWWRHQMETFSALLAFCAGNSPVPVNSPHKGQWRGALMFPLICAWINDWVNNREAGDLRRHRGHYDVNVMWLSPFFRHVYWAIWIFHWSPRNNVLGMQCRLHRAKPVSGQGHFKLLSLGCTCRKSYFHNKWRHDMDTIFALLVLCWGESWWIPLTKDQ